MIYAFGNSNVAFFTNVGAGGKGPARNEHFVSLNANYGNPEYIHVLAYKFMERYYKVLVDYLKESKLTSDDYVLLVIGEIDCRWNLAKKVREEKLPPKEVVQECIDTFFFPAFLKLKEDGYNVIGWGNHPVTSLGHTEHHKGCSTPLECLNGNQLALLWEEELSKRCKDNDIKFVSILKELMDSDGVAKLEYYSDQHHLSQLAMPLAMEAFKKENLIKP